PARLAVQAGLHAAAQIFEREQLFRPDLMGQDQAFLATSSLPVPGRLRQVNQLDRTMVSSLGVANLAMPVVIVHDGSRWLVSAGAIAAECPLDPCTWPEAAVGHLRIEGTQHGRQREPEGCFRGTQLFFAGWGIGKTVALGMTGTGMAQVQRPPIPTIPPTFLSDTVTEFGESRIHRFCLSRRRSCSRTPEWVVHEKRLSPL